MRNYYVCLLVGGIAGCGAGSRAPVSIPSYDVEAMAGAAMAAYDKNGDGALDAAELEACPGLKASLANIDANKDKKLTPDELKARFESYERSGAGAVGYTIRLWLDGAPLTDANVTLTPESFMGSAIGPATGKSNADGAVTTYAVGTRELPGVPCGVYKIAVTKEGASIPAKYNTQTTLGGEVSGGGRSGNSILELRLTTGNASLPIKSR